MAVNQPKGYLADPSGGDGRPVLVLHAWWGLNDTIKTTCDRLAESGFTAFTPDLYGGQVTNTIEGAETLAGALFDDLGPPRAIVAEAATYLSDLAGETAGDIAVLGFSLGAFFALDLSVNAPELVSRVVVYYGTGPEDFSTSQAAYLGHFAEFDEFEPQSQVKSVKEALETAGRPVTFHFYPGTGHWFAEPDRPEAYNERASDLAWERTLRFLQE